jgi:hypothetical protein
LTPPQTKKEVQSPNLEVKQKKTQIALQNLEKRGNVFKEFVKRR